MRGAAISIEMSPLVEGQYTGIPEVAARLCEAALREIERGRDIQFFLEYKQIPVRLVEELVDRRSGEILRWINANILLEPVSPVIRGRPCIGVFPNQKTVRSFFARETQIIHDLSTLITPEFHHQDTINFHAAPFVSDAQTNDLSICVSQATADDLTTYFGDDLIGDVTVCRLGANNLEFEMARARMVVPPPDKFVLVLGTIEPRKNIEFLLKAIQEHPKLLEKCTFLFVGRMGWGSVFPDLLRKYDLTSAVDSGRIVSLGFVDQGTKSLLISLADCVVYPSLFEGFGLPIAEALAARTAIITTNSSSLREAGGDKAHYISVNASSELAAALEAATQAPRPHWPPQGLRSWENFTDDVFDALDRLARDTGMDE